MKTLSEVYVFLIVVAGSIPIAVTSTSEITPVLSKEPLDIEATEDSRFIPKRVCDMKNTQLKIFLLLHTVLLVISSTTGLRHLRC